MAGVLNELLNYIDGAKRTVRNNLQLWLEAPEVAAARTAENLDQQIAAFQADPAGRIGDFIPGGGAAGIIRKGGLDDLVAVHQAPVDRYAVWAQSRGALPQEMMSPSVAINKGAITQDFGKESGTGGTITFVARPDALDPARINAQLFNRDAYTPREAYYRGGRSDLLVGLLEENAQKPFAAYGSSGAAKPGYLKRTFAGDRLADRFQREGARFKESGTTELMAREHRQAIQSSPSFRSFAEYEASPRGAALLQSGELGALSPAAAADLARRRFYEELHKLDEIGNPAARKLLLQGEKTLDADVTGYILGGKKEGLRSELFEGPGGDGLRAIVRDYRKALAYLPSQYGELKVSGPLQIRGNNWAGAIIQPQKGSKIASPDNVNALAELLRQRGIPTMINDPAGPLTPQDLGWLARAYSEGVIK